jgi:peptidoglycan/xylan/chitin deacetylase (PgdA/CDA1 family)
MTVRRHLVELGVAVVVLVATMAVADILWRGGPAPAAPPDGVVTVDPAALRGATTTNVCTKGGIALTFDDGPDRYTDAILTVLRAYGVHATFFVMGVKAQAHPELIRAEVTDGHRVENHSWSHPHLSDLSAAEIDHQLSATQQAIVAAGAPPPSMLRPPFGDADAEVDAAAARANLKVVRWSMDTNDWRGRTAQDITAAVLDHLSPGQVVLMHDGVQESRNTLAALPSIIRGLRDRGYCTTTMTAG